MNKVNGINEMVDRMKMVTRPFSNSAFRIVGLLRILIKRAVRNVTPVLRSDPKPTMGLKLQVALVMHVLGMFVFVKQ